MPQIIRLGRSEPTIATYREKPIKETINIPDELLQNNLKDTILQTNQGKLVYSMRDVAKLINMSYEFIRRNTKNGKIRTIQFGDRTMIQIDELARIMNQGI